MEEHLSSEQLLPQEIKSIPPTSINQKQNNIFRWLFLLIVVALLSSGGTYFVLKSQSKQDISGQEKTEIIIQPSPTRTFLSPTTDPTLNWRTYTNTRLGYSIKYPADWKYVEDHPQGQDGCITTADQKGILEGIGGGYNIQQGMLICMNDVGNAKAEKYQKEICNQNGDIKGDGVSTCNLVTYDNQPALKREDRYEYPMGDFSKGYMYVILSFERKNISIHLLYQPNIQNDRVINQILSTLKFTNWRTYNNNQAKIFFEYPDNWVIETYEIPGYNDLHGVALMKHQSKEYGPAPGAVSIRYWDNPKNLTLEEFENIHKGPAGGIKIFYPDATKIILASTDSYYTDQADCAPVNCSKYIIPHKSKIYDISIFTRTLGENKFVVDQILSTFRFLE